MIKTDGERSKKKIWYANKQIFIVQDLDIPVKVTKYDGFLVRVWQVKDLAGQDYISGGLIKAPMGAAIACSNADGVKIAIADNWIGGITGSSDLYYLFYNGHFLVLNNSIAEELAAMEIEATIVRFRPVVATAWYDNPSGPDEEFNQYPSLPFINPYKSSEALRLTLTDHVFLDFNNNNLPDYPYPLLESSILGYGSSGSNLSGRRSVSAVSGANDIWKTCLNLSDGSQCAFAEGYYDYVDANTEPGVPDYQFTCANIIDETTNVQEETIFALSHLFLRDVVPAVAPYSTMLMPEHEGEPRILRDLMLSLPISTIRPIGSYSFLSTEGERVYLHAAYFSPSAIPIGGPDTTINGYFDDYPGDDNWRMFLSFTVGGRVHLLNATQFIGTLDTLSTEILVSGGVTAWEDASEMMKYLFPWPNMPGRAMIYFGWKPHDSVMFHAEDNKVYVWTRAVGSVVFDTTGMFTTTLLLPTEVTGEEGVRPDITFSGGSLYLCVCNKVGTSIRAVYYGSPFIADEWHKFPDPPTYYTLMHVRPVTVTTEEILLLGVVRYAPPEHPGDDPLPTDVPTLYRFAKLSYKYVGDPEWTLMAQLPFEINEEDTFTTCLFGDDKYVKLLTDYPSPPPANPQNIVIPYDGYATWQP